MRRKEFEIMKDMIQGSLAYILVAGLCTLGVRVTNDLYDKVKNSRKNKKAQK